jgi:D-sedoheptulose 7-phosphate isomerase
MKNSEFVAIYNTAFTKAFEGIEAFDGETKISYDLAIEKCVNMVLKAQSDNKKIMFAGNGGSAGITSHMAIDFWKNGKVKATAFNDSSLLTCLANDISFEHVFSTPIEMFGEKGDIAMVISSSGSSKNILNAAEQAAKSGCSVITFSGFNTANALKKMGHINFYVPAFSYGFVEVIHNLIIHCILDSKMYCKDSIDIFNKNTAM